MLIAQLATANIYNIIIAVNLFDKKKIKNNDTYYLYNNRYIKNQVFRLIIHLIYVEPIYNINQMKTVDGDIESNNNMLLKHNKYIYTGVKYIQIKSIYNEYNIK